MKYLKYPIKYAKYVYYTYIILILFYNNFIHIYFILSPKILIN